MEKRQIPANISGEWSPDKHVRTLRVLYKRATTDLSVTKRQKILAFTAYNPISISIKAPLCEPVNRFVEAENSKWRTTLN